MAVTLIFETHSLTTDNEAGRATGWLEGELSDAGRRLAAELGERRADAGAAAVFTSDLERAVQTAEIAFAGSGVPILRDWRLRECNYGSLNGGPSSEMHDQKLAHVDVAYPGGESWRQAIERGGWFLRDVASIYDDAVLIVIGHVATKWALDHHLRAIPVADLVAAPFEWQAGWTYALDAQTGRSG